MLAALGCSLCMQAHAQDFYLLIGQSNMAGRAPFVVAEDLNRFPDGSLYILNQKDEFVPIGPYPFINHHSTIRKSAALISPGVSFAEALLEADPGKPVYLVSNARGGTSIHEWVKGTEYYNEAVRRTRAGMKFGTLRGILWHQGETDYRQVLRQATPEARAEALEAYFKVFRQFITDLRGDLDAPAVPFVAGQLNKGFPGFNERLLRLPGELPDTYVVTSESLETRDDSHFDREAVEKLGRRYAAVILRLRKR